MDYIDYYKALGITKSASTADIKSAYRKLARKHHPDLNPGDQDAEKKFKELNEANEVLSDPDKRAKYDQYGKDWKHPESAQQTRQQQQRRGNNDPQFSGDDFSDLFGSMFGGGGGRRQQPKFRGQDFNAELSLNLTETYKSRQHTITVNGKNIRLTIPAGVENGQVIKIKGHGSAGANGGPNGDLYLKFSIMNDTKFKRDGKNLYSDVEIDLYTALLGGEVQVETFDGKVKLKVPSETQSGTKVKLKGKGFPVYKNDTEFGDLYITYHVKLPTQLSAKEIELFTELKNLKDGK